MTSQEMRQTAAGYVAEANKIKNEAGDNLDESAFNRINELIDLANKLQRDADVSDKLNSANQQLNTATRLVTPATTKPAFGSKKLQKGEFIANVFRSGCKGDYRARELLNTVTTFGGEGTDADGGYLVPDDYRTNVIGINAGGQSILDFIPVLPTNSHVIHLPVDTDYDFNLSSGIYGARANEGATASETKLALGNLDITVYKDSAMVYVSEELLSDSAFAEPYVINKIQRKMRKAIEQEVMAGAYNSSTGCKGITTATCATLVLPDADGYLTPEVASAMFARLPTESQSRAVWCIDREVYADLIGTTVGSYFPGFLPPGGISGAQYNTIFGRPVVINDFSPSRKAKGAIALVDPNAFILVQNGGLRIDSSNHFQFGQQLVAFRGTWRVGGAPMLTAQINLPNGMRMSPIVLSAAV